jgi:mannose-6-phosphate isomerase-like protein (cupin superfamily)
MAEVKGPGEPRLLVVAESEVPEVASRGAQVNKRVFERGRTPFESSFDFILRNRLPPGGANEAHVHPDVEKVYYFLSGSGEVKCGPWSAKVTAGDFLFFPAAIEHELQADADSALEFIVCAAKTLGTPRGLDE